MIEWRTNQDEALVAHRDGTPVGAVWRGAWRSPDGNRYDEAPTGYRVQDGALAALWNPYRRLGRFLKAGEAKAAVEREAS